MRINTGFKDVNGKEIYTGDKVYEGCNGLIGTVGWDPEVGTFKLIEYGDYYIQDAPIEWEVISEIEKGTQENHTGDIVYENGHGDYYIKEGPRGRKINLEDLQGSKKEKE